MSMKSSHRDAAVSVVRGASCCGASPGVALPPADSLMSRGSGVGRRKVLPNLQHRNANERAVRFVAVSAPAPPVAPVHPPSRRLIWLLTIATGASVANLYYNQPLLSDIARTFDAAPRAAGAIATLTQAGYAVGLLLFVP